jgi:hypothetical protein
VARQAGVEGGSVMDKRDEDKRSYWFQDWTATVVAMAERIANRYGGWRNVTAAGRSFTSFQLTTGK